MTKPLAADGAAPSVHDVLAPGEAGEATADAAALVDAARTLAAAVLAPAAESTDQATIVPWGHIEALAAAGLQGLMGPVEYGGHAAASPVVRDVFEVLAGACGVTFFVWVQHHAPVRLLAASSNLALRHRHLPGLCRGDVLGGVAFAYLRRPGPPAVVARRIPGGYRIEGEAPWVTSWGLASLYAVAATVIDSAEEPSGDIVYVCLPGTTTDAVRPSAPLDLVVMNASSTVRLTFAGLFVPDDDVISTMPQREWEVRDLMATARPNPAAFGIASSCVARLTERGSPAADALAEELASCRSHSYRLADTVLDSGTDLTDHVVRLVDARAWSLDLAVRSAESLVVATGGRAMARSDPAQRLLREAAFFTIQAQTRALREATLRRLTG